MYALQQQQGQRLIQTYTIWMDTISRGRFEDTNDMFETPEDIDYHVSEWFEDTHQKLLEVISAWMQRNLNG